jgi:hypothetical protein
MAAGVLETFIITTMPGMVMELSQPPIKWVSGVVSRE